MPYLPKQPGYHKRVKAAAPVIRQATRYLATLCPSWTDGLRLWDATPVPCGMSRPTVQRSELAGLAGYGYCAGPFPLVLGAQAVSVDHTGGTAGGVVPGQPQARRAGGRRRPAGSCPRPASAPTRHGGADKGLSGQGMERYCADQIGVLLVRPDRKDESRRFGNLAGMRQWIESVNDTVKGQLGLADHGGRTPAGVYARVAQRLSALAAAIWHNWRVNTENKRSSIAYDH